MALLVDYSMYNSMYFTSRGRPLRTELSHRHISACVLFPNNTGLMVCESSIRRLSPYSITPESLLPLLTVNLDSCSECVLDILRKRHILQIVHTAIEFIPIFMVDGEALWTRPYEMMCDEFVNSKMICLTIAVQGHDRISSTIGLIFQKAIAKVGIYFA